MMEPVWDENIRLSIEESNAFIDLSSNRRLEGRNDAGAEPSDPYNEQVRNQTRGARTPDQDFSETWRNLTKNFREMFRIICGLTHRLYNCCIEEPNVCESLALLVLRCCGCMKWSCKLTAIAPRRILRLVNQTRVASFLTYFTRRNLRQNDQIFHGTDEDETRILIDGDHPQGTI